MATDVDAGLVRSNQARRSQGLEDVESEATGKLDGNPEVGLLPVLPSGEGGLADVRPLGRLIGGHSTHGAEHVGVPGSYHVPRHLLLLPALLFIVQNLFDHATAHRGDVVRAKQPKHCPYPLDYGCHNYYYPMGKALKMPLKGPNSPWSAGNRTIVARTCTKCGELADGDSFPLLNTGKKNQARRRVCHNCQNLQKKKDREERGIGLPPRTRPSEPLQTSKYQQWTTMDEKYLREAYAEGYSYEDIALALGRSANAVFLRRAKLGLPRLRKVHRVEKPWRIGHG